MIAYLNSYCLVNFCLYTIGLSMDQSYDGGPGGVKGYPGFGF